MTLEGPRLIEVAAGNLGIDLTTMLHYLAEYLESAQLLPHALAYVTRAVEDDDAVVSLPASVPWLGEDILAEDDDDFEDDPLFMDDDGEDDEFEFDGPDLDDDDDDDDFIDDDDPLCPSSC